MSLIRSLFARVVDNLRTRVRTTDLPAQLPKNPRDLLALGQATLRKLLLPPHVAEQERHAGLSHGEGDGSHRSAARPPPQAGAAWSWEPSQSTSKSQSQSWSGGQSQRQQHPDKGEPARDESAEGLARLAQLARDSGIAGIGGSNVEGPTAAIDASPTATPSPSSASRSPVALATHARTAANDSMAVGGITRPGQPPTPVEAQELAATSRAGLSKFELGPHSVEPPPPREDLDEHLPPLPDGYGDRRIFLLPRGPEWLIAQWDFVNDQKDEARRQGGVQLGLRVYESTDGHRVVFAEYVCDELARQFYVPVVPDRRYAVELGYWTRGGEWLPLGHSSEAWSPPNAPRQGRAVFATIPYERPRSTTQTVALAAWRDALWRRAAYAGLLRTSLTADIASVLDSARRALNGGEANEPNVSAFNGNEGSQGAAPLSRKPPVAASSPTSPWGAR